MRIIIKKSKNGQYYFILKARNGRTLMTSETYKTKQAVEKTAYMVAGWYIPVFIKLK